MKHSRAVLGGLFLLIFLPHLVCAQAQNYKISPIGSGLREYLPGDIVHIVIEAPPDTNNVKAVMPDGLELSLYYDGRYNVWQGHWEVPPGFKKGLYTAQLIAGDFAGVTFRGESTPFYVAEPVLSLMMRIASLEGGAGKPLTAQERTAQKRALQSAHLAIEARRKAALATTEAVAQPTIIRPGIKAAGKKRPVRLAAKRPAQVAAKRGKFRRVARLQPGEDLNVTKARLIIAARSYLAKLQYNNAKTELKALLKIEPDNREIKTIINRLEAVGRARGDNR